MHITLLKNSHSLLILALLLCTPLFSIKKKTKKQALELFEEAKKAQSAHPNKALELYAECIDLYIAFADTNKIANIKLKQISLNSGLANYQTAYDIAWSLQPYVQTNNYLDKRIELNIKMITLYLIYEQYIKADILIKETFGLINEAENTEIRKVNLQVQIRSLKAWSISENSKNYIEAEALILQNIDNHKKQNNSTYKIEYANLQLAQLYIMMYRLDDAYKILRQIEGKYADKENSVKCLLYEYFGRYYQKTNNTTKAIHYFKKAVHNIDSFNTHISNKVKILENISSLYASVKNYTQAYEYIIAAKQLKESVFSSTNEQNKKLFEIKDEYKLELKQSEESIKNQKLALLEQEKKYWLLELFSALGIFLFVLSISMIYYRRKSKQTLLKQEFEQQNQLKLLEFKNKELLSSALQLIERDTLQEEIKRKLETISVKDENKSIIKQITKLLSVNKSQKWKEFDTHFTAVNNDYYKLLKSNFPKLTSTDLKICAFIKLGFSSKDMAQIMGIGVEGINTTRSRLRKKMDLTRNIVLSDFLQNLSADK